MTARLREGARAVVRVPGSSANLGPGYDSLGLALAVHDEVEVEAVDPALGARVQVEGEGAAQIATGETNLVVRSVRTALARVGADQPGLVLRCRNGVPHGRGVGSSAAAVVAGVVAARGLLERPDLLDDGTALEVATDLEGHPDNAAASLLGGITIGWTGAGAARAVRVDPHPDLACVVAVPDAELSTARARAMLPPTVPHADAAFTAGRAALLVEALSRHPDLLLAATEERLHQAYRAPAMPDAATALALLRGEGLAAVVSGAGPSLLVLGTADADLPARAAALLPAWRVLDPGVDREGAVLTTP
ncbi:homoserine kinase [Angustibacter speluncae]